MVATANNTISGLANLPVVNGAIRPMVVGGAAVALGPGVATAINAAINALQKTDGAGTKLRYNPTTKQWYKVVNGQYVRVILNTPEPPPKQPPGGSGGVHTLSAASLQPMEDLFLYWLGAGKYTVAQLKQAVQEQWTADDVRRYACDIEATGEGMGMALSEVRKALAQAGLAYGVPSDPTVYSLIKSGIYTQSGFGDYLTTMSGFDWTKSAQAGQFMDYWNEVTGSPMTTTAIQQVQTAVRDYGWSGAWAWFQSWSKSTESAVTGNYGDSKRLAISEMVATLLHRDATAEELNATGELWNKDTAGLLEYIRGTDDYQVIYAAKPNWMKEETFLAQHDAFDEAYRRIYAIHPTPLTNADGSYLAGAIAGMPDDLLNYYLSNEISADEVLQEAQWMEDASYLRGTAAPLVQEVLGRTLTDDELYTIASGAKGSGQLRALLLEAQNRAKFKESFRQYNGRDPEATDYEYLNNNYISPDEYARVTSAYESAASKLPEVNEVVQRVLGKSYTLEQLQGMVLGSQGSGAMQAEINQAIKLDSYTEAYTNQHGKAPTPDEYASFAGYSSAAALTRQYQIDESIAEYRTEIQETFAAMGREITDEDLEVLFREGEGSGALKAQWKKAQEIKAKDTQDDKAAMNAQYASVPFSQAKTGGVELAVKPKQMLPG